MHCCQGSQAIEEKHPTHSSEDYRYNSECLGCSTVSSLYCVFTSGEIVSNLLVLVTTLYFSGSG